MPPPPPPAGAPGAPTPPMPPAAPESISISKLNGNIDSSSIVIKGTRDGKEITVTVKGSNKNISPKDQANIVMKPSSSQKEKPLIVIDGVITSEINLNDLNPTNIQSMNVLKGEKATAKYGEKGANGVVEITTKKP
jgi:TonB-dependent SusC/RagA subfamily outer membrane receptor